MKRIFPFFGLPQLKTIIVIFSAISHQDSSFCKIGFIPEQCNIFSSCTVTLSRIRFKKHLTIPSSFSFSFSLSQNGFFLSSFLVLCQSFLKTFPTKFTKVQCFSISPSAFKARHVLSFRFTFNTREIRKQKEKTAASELHRTPHRFLHR